jgi:hypothetical protein
MNKKIVFSILGVVLIGFIIYKVKKKGFTITGTKKYINLNNKKKIIKDKL